MAELVVVLVVRRSPTVLAGHLAAAFLVVIGYQAVITAMRSGDISYLAGDGPLLAFTRVAGGEKLLVRLTTSELYNTLEEYGIKECYYGHLHGNSHKDAIEGNIGGINFHLISADYLDFKLVKII